MPQKYVFLLKNGTNTTPKVRLTELNLSILISNIAVVRFT